MTSFIIVLIVIAVLIAAYSYGLKSYFHESECAREVHTICTDDGWRINLYRYFDPTRHGEPVFLCHGISGNRYNFIYPRGNSLIDHLVQEGYDCWAIDLRGNRSSQPPQGVSRHSCEMDEYLRYDLPAALNHVLDTTQASQLHWVGHSMGGMLLYAYELMHGRELIASGTTLGTPPGFENVRMSHHPFVLMYMNGLPALAEFSLRLVSPFIPVLKLSNSFAPINWKNMSEGIRFYNLMELPPPKCMKQLDEWARTDTWWVDENSIDVLTGLKALETPLFIVGGKLDGIAPPKNLEFFHKWLPTPDKRLLILSRENGAKEDYDHVDLVFSPNGKAELYEPICEWIADHAHRNVHAEHAETQLEALKKSKAAIDTLELAPASVATKSENQKPKEITPAADEQWSKALESAASVLTGFNKGPAKPKRKVKSKQKSVRKQKAAKKKSVKARAKKTKPAPKKKSNPKKKPVIKKKPLKKTKPAAKKPTRKKASPKKKAATKKKTAAKKKRK